MRHLLLSLHLLLAIFVIGPLVGTATTAARGVRAGDGSAVAAAARTVRIYGIGSLLVAVLGSALVQDKWHAKMTYPWVWISMLLFVLALALTFAVLAPSLNKAAEAINAGAGGTALAGRVAASGGLIALLYAVIVFLMVFQPK